MKIFIGGSRSIKQLNRFEIDRIDRLIDDNAEILIGDCDGVDMLVQEYLNSKNYNNVTVYSITKNPIINIGNWNQKHIDPMNFRKTILFHRQYMTFLKDFEMSIDADLGFMIWDGNSNGTFADMTVLLAFKKSTMIRSSLI